MNDGEDVTRQEVWDRWINQYVTPDQHVPLFASNEQGFVQTESYGQDTRPILKHHPDMVDLLVEEGSKVVDDWEGSDDTYEGVIYMMYTLDDQELIPRYIGKTGKYGRDGERLSANLNNIRTNRSKFARWGKGYAYHFGELSRALLDLHEREGVSSDDGPSAKYQLWADELFVDGTRELVEPVYFWARAWREDDIGPFYGFETRLEALEYNLINLGSELYGDAVLNTEGA
jgi:hypothetical protein